MLEVVVLGSTALVVLGALAGYVYRRQENSKKELIAQLILLATSRNATEYTLSKASAEGRLAPPKVDIQPVMDDETEAWLAERRKAATTARMQEFGFDESEA